MGIRAGLMPSFIIGCLSFAILGKPSVLFYSSYINMNSLHYYGMLIDSSGDISDYQFFIRTWPSSELDLLSLLDTMLAVSIPTGKRVAADTLYEMEALIEPASKGVVTLWPIGCCCDMGVFRYSAVKYDSLDSSLNEIICFQSGEQTACNSSDDAKAIARWLNSIDSVQNLTYSGMVRAFNVIDSSALADLSACAPPDSCLYLTVAVFPVKPANALKVPFASPAAFYLNGQKVVKPSRQLMVGKKGKIPINLKLTSPNRNKVR